MTDPTPAAPLTWWRLMLLWLGRTVLALAALALLAVAVLQLWPESDTLLPMTRNGLSILLAPVGAVLGLVWFALFSGRRWWVRLVGVTAVLAFAASLVASVRDVEFSGDVVPTVRFVWQPTRAEAIAATRRQVADDSGLRFVGPPSLLQYRGPQGQGVIDAPQFGTDWQAAPPTLLWKQPIGGGYAQFVVSGDVAVTIEQRGGDEVVACYEAATGKEVWTFAYPALFSEAMGGDGPRATPTIAGERVYAVGGQGDLHCLDLRTGAEVWHADTLAGAGGPVQWGMSSSPLVTGGMVVVNPGRNDPASAAAAVRAYDAATGELSWANGETEGSYASPERATLAGIDQLVIFDGLGLAGLDPADGRELWRQPFETGPRVNAAQPLFLGGDRVFVSNGYGKGNSAVVQVTRDAENAWTADLLWENSRFTNRFSNPVATGGFVYGLREGILMCVDLADGGIRWKSRGGAGGYGHGQLLLVHGVILIQCENGQVALVRPDPDRAEEVARIDGVEGKTWNVPAVAGDLLLVRNHLEAACFRSGALR